MRSIAREQIKRLFTNPIETMIYGLYFSGYEGEGEYKLWYENGKLWIRCFFKNDKYEGEFKAWQKNGQLYKHCFFKNGEVVKDYLEEK